MLRRVREIVSNFLNNLGSLDLIGNIVLIPYKVGDVWLSNIIAARARDSSRVVIIILTEPCVLLLEFTEFSAFLY